MGTPLERPELPAIEAPIEWPAYVVAVFGPGDREFAEALVAARPGSALTCPVLRHAPGSELRDGSVVAHPDALLEALRAQGPPADFVVGVGAPFAVAVRADLCVWIADGRSALELPLPLRGVARRAALVLEDARPGVARELARTL